MADGTELSKAASVAATLGGSLAVLVVWQLVGANEVFGSSIAPPTDVLDVLGKDSERELIVRAAMVTGGEAVRGFLWGAVLAVIAGALVVVVPALRKGVDQLATIQSAVPFVAMAPILLANFDRATVPTAMAAATVFFTIYVAVVAGLQAASKTLHEVFAVFGSSRRQRLMRAQLPAAIPVVATGLKVAMPLAIVGAVIGEWFGSSKGIGPVLLVALRNYQMPKMWAAATATVVVALALFGVMAIVERSAIRRFGGSA